MSAARYQLCRLHCFFWQPNIKYFANAIKASYRIVKIEKVVDEEQIVVPVIVALLQVGPNKFVMEEWAIAEELKTRGETKQSDDGWSEAKPSEGDKLKI